MTKRALVYFISVVLVVSIIYTVYFTQNNEIESNGIEFSALLDLTNDNSTITAIGSYMINKDREPETPYIIVTTETLEKERISIELGAILNSARALNIGSFSRSCSSIFRNFIPSRPTYSLIIRLSNGLLLKLLKIITSMSVVKAGGTPWNR